jgi:putative endonuclease
MFYVYILELSNGKFYVGQTNDIEQRVRRHQNGYSKYTKAYRPIILRHYECFSTRGEAMQREKQLKALKSHKAHAEIIKSNTTDTASSSNG